MTPNGEVAVVRANHSSIPGASNSKLSLWATDTPSALQAQITPTGSPVGQGNLPVSSFGLPRFSDAIAVTNDRVVSIASNATEDRTYVDILSIDYSTDPPSATALQTHQLGTGTSGPTIAGLAHDVAITPDGALAVVSHRNWIHVFRLSDGAPAAEFNIGSHAAWPCDPGDARGSIAVTNTRAVVAVQRTLTSPPFQGRTWVYIVDLTAPTSDPQILLEHSVGELPNSPLTDTSPHDVVITPNGQRAVVVANHLVTLYSLVNDTVLGSPLGVAGDYRNWNATYPLSNLWDSVEVSNARAVVLSNVHMNDPLAHISRWRATVYDIGSAALTWLWAYQSTNYMAVQPPGEPYSDPAWDVAMSDDGLFASIKTQWQDVVLTDLASPGPGDLRAAGPFANFATPTDFTPSTWRWAGNDATTILQPLSDPPRLWAVFAGGGGRVEMNFYDLYASTWQSGSSVLEFDILANPTGTQLSPADMDRSVTHVEVLLRNSAPFADPAIAGRPDWIRYSGVTQGQVGSSWGGSGTCAVSGDVIMADVQRLGRGKAVSISQDLTTPLTFDG